MSSVGEGVEGRAGAAREAKNSGEEKGEKCENMAGKLALHSLSLPLSDTEPSLTSMSAEKSEEVSEERAEEEGREPVGVREVEEASQSSSVKY